MRELTIVLLLTFVTTAINAKPQAPYIALPKVEKTEVLDRDSLTGGFNELLPYIQPSPYQGNAGTCLFMAHTGAIEWWLAKLAEHRNPLSNGNYDLSERFSANLKTLDTGSEFVKNWRTDTIYRFNSIGYSYLNRDYPFTQGWYKRDVQNNRVPALPNEEGAFYGINYNWIAEFDQVEAPKVLLPKFTRDVFYADPKQNQWNIGGAPSDIVTTVKNALETNKAPVIVIYNHMGFWHTVVIVGHDDQFQHDCAYTKAFAPYMNSRAQEIRTEADSQTDPAAKRKLLAKARTFESRAKNAQKIFESVGGCKNKGVFYVRDSIYPDETLPLYDYDTQNEGEEVHYSSTIVAREYQWLEIFANHVYQIKLQ